MTAVTSNGKALRYASEFLQKDREIVIAAVKNSGDALKYAAKYLKCDREIVMNAVQNNGKSLEYAYKELQNNREFVLADFIKNKQPSKFALINFKNDREIVMTAVTNNGEAERVYYSVVKNLPQNISFQHYHYTHFLNLVGVAQYNTTKYEESFKTLLKAWHMTPMESNVLFNFSIISNQIANMCIDKQKKTSDEVDIIMNIVKVSIKILHYLAETKKAIGTSEKTFEKRELMLKENTAKVRSTSFCFISLSLVSLILLFLIGTIEYSFTTI
jgi:hypothetical protein